MVRKLMTRPLMGGLFLLAGLDAFSEPRPRAETASPVLDAVVARLPEGLATADQLVQFNGAAMAAGGALLALGIAPRLMAGLLAASLSVTTLGGHRFWEIEDEAERRQQLVHFLKNAAILGGLLESI